MRRSVSALEASMAEDEKTFASMHRSKLRFTSSGSNHPTPPCECHGAAENSGRGGARRGGGRVEDGGGGAGASSSSPASNSEGIEREAHGLEPVARDAAGCDAMRLVAEGAGGESEEDAVAQWEEEEEAETNSEPGTTRGPGGGAGGGGGGSGARGAKGLPRGNAGTEAAGFRLLLDPGGGTALGAFSLCIIRDDSMRLTQPMRGARDLTSLSFSAEWTQWKPCEGVRQPGTGEGNEREGKRGESGVSLAAATQRAERRPPSRRSYVVFVLTEPPLFPVP